VSVAVIECRTPWDLLLRPFSQRAPPAGSSGFETSVFTGARKCEGAPVKGRVESRNTCRRHRRRSLQHCKVALSPLFQNIESNQHMVPSREDSVGMKIPWTLSRMTPKNHSQARRLLPVEESHPGQRGHKSLFHFELVKRN